MKRLLALLTVCLFMLAALACAASADAGAIEINSVVFTKYMDEFGYEDDSLVKATVNFTAPEGVKKIAVFVATENIDVISNNNKPKIVYLNQGIYPNGGVFSFVVEKDRIKKAANKLNIENTPLYIKAGAGAETSLAAAKKTVLFNVYDSANLTEIACSFSPNANFNNAIVNVEIANPPERGELIVSMYDSENRLLNFNTVPINGESRFLSIGAYSMARYSYVKLFVWDSLQGMKPISNVCTLATNSNAQ